MDRHAAVAGQFYPADPGQIRSLVENARRDQIPRPVLGAVLPHAGYVYSGHVAAQTLANVQLPPTAVVLGVTHRGLGSSLAVWPEGAWITPLGGVDVDSALARALLDASDAFSDDTDAHRGEHSIEVQLPILQVLAPDVKILPVTVGHLSYGDLIEVGRALADVIRGREPRPVLLASSDMTHYESEAEARRKDRLAIECIRKLDPEALWQTVRANSISMCGVAPVTIMLSAARELGATCGELIDYRTSGDATGDRAQVVGYAGMVVF